MKLKFDSSQEYQIDAISAIAEIFEGQHRIETELSFSSEFGSFATVPNRLDLDEVDLLANLQEVQRRNDITPDPTLRYIESDIEVAGQTLKIAFPNFSVEMETGTGKTYVYLRTTLELFQRYGMRKFIVVVPSIAVREGVLKTLQITVEHFRNLYGNIPYRFYTYDSDNLSQIRQFALSDSLEIMVMTLASFNKASNVIRQSTDRLQGETPIHLIQATRPILILDEPQNMESEISIAALSVLNPLFALRYSATHRNPYNIVYRLTPWEAYRQGLVKKIEVASVVKENDANRPYIQVGAIAVQKRSFTVRLGVRILGANGSAQEKTITVKPGDSLEAKTRRPEYSGYTVGEINAGQKYVKFEVQGKTLRLAEGESIGTDKADLFEAQIRYTIREHLEKQEYLRSQGIKVLSLFFIDAVNNYAPAEGTGMIRETFDRAFEELKHEYPQWKERTAPQIQAAYFAQKRTRGGDTIFDDSKSGDAQKDQEAYDLIMKDKERLLSLEEPVAFIFSHSALREGWDNPNVFQICTLNQSLSDMKKRQEIGRGVRLAVNQEGERVHDEAINVLTVVANESYETYVMQLQSEIALEYRVEIEARFGKSIETLSDEERARISEEYGEGILPPKPANARQRGEATLRKEYVLKPEFQELWKRIQQKTRYAVKIDTPRLIQEVIAELNEAEIKPPRITITKAQVSADDENMFTAIQMSGAKTVKSLIGRYPLPNLLELMDNLMQHTSPPIRITRKTMLSILQSISSKQQQAMIDNPNEFVTVAVQIIKAKLATQMVHGIEYEPINEWYEMTQLEESISSWMEHMEPAPHKGVYSHAIVESDIERQFVKDLEKRTDVKLYIKLPRWFKVITPIGEYNPDWAIVMEPRDTHGRPTGGESLYLVRETKSTLDSIKLRPGEAQKIRYAKKHFQALAEKLGETNLQYARYKDTITASTLPDWDADTK